MKTFSLQFGTIMLCAILLTTNTYAGGFQLNEHGARAMAQGGAWAARAYDGSAMYFNPAGLGFQQDASIYAGTTLIMPKVSFYGPVAYANDPAIKNESKMSDQTFTPINAYITYPITEDLHVGFGVLNAYGLGTQWDDNWVGKYLTTKIDLQSFYYTPTISYKISDQLAVGVGASIVLGSVKINRAVSLPVADVNGIITGSRISLDMKSKRAYGYNVGILYKATPEVNVGVSYRSSVKIDAKGSAVFTPNIPTLGINNDNVSASLELPATGFFGVSYKVSPEFEIEADYQYIGWSAYKELAIDFELDPTKNIVAPKDYQDTYMIRVGGEYTMGDLQIRAGYLYDHSPVKEAYVEPLLPDANRNGLNIGAGYKITDALSADVSYMFLKFDQRKVTNTVVGFDGTYNSLANLIGVNLGYTF